ncbi:hypothetical protein ACQR1Y_12275 [Bradyrhizobium sp. HKCCYLRH3099]|uniref:hypothetical protein n=1 Tax=unclassified Bradyrhizobium TaxID=2631580 RepID=UPI003EBD5949
MMVLKRRWMRVCGLAGAVMLAGWTVALADYVIKDGLGIPGIVKAFVCETSKICSAHVIIKSDGTEVSPATSGKQDTANLALGAPGDAACATDTSTCGLNALLQRANQRLTTLINGSFRTTYRIAGTFTPAASATDAVTVTGSGTKTLRIVRVTVAATIGSAAQGSFALIKRSSADSGGTSTTPSPVSLDSTNASATGVVRVYTANPAALGTAVGTIAQRFALFSTTTTQPDRVTFEFGDNYKQAVVLRGTAEQIGINFGGASPTSASYEIEWTEE